MSVIKKIIVVVALVLGFAVLAQSSAALALFEGDSAKEACQGVSLGTAGGCGDGGGRITDVIATIVNILSAVVGIVAVIMLMVAGFKYVTASGDSSKLSAAKSTGVYAVIGLVIAALAQTFVRFVLNKIN